ncbi:MAG TPA: hydrogenase maturation protease [Candidatus Marinimicrobia bacterium]|nr:hydrogenase maturation protease [Candidatus Neomarinimicrobiota bacterium]HRD19263.1 hydrogenase maturation protease [Candidatus Neomarinimicrobiota bacterium]
MNFNDLKKTLAVYHSDRIIFVGLGNRDCGDDGASQILLNKLKHSEEFKGAKFIFAGTNPENYLQKIADKNPQAVVFIDTAHFQAKPGTLKFLEAKHLKPSDFSTHAFSISLIADYLTYEKPCEIYYLGIQPQNTSVGQPLSDSVKAGLKHFFS